MIKRYGKQFPSGWSALEIELWCLRQDTREDYEGGRLSSFDHFKKAVDIVFNNKESTRRHVWHEWNEKFYREALGDRARKRFLSVAGCGSSGKSDMAGMYALIMYLSSPATTLVLATSVSLKEAHGRIWKAIPEYWKQAEFYFRSLGQVPPGKLTASKGLIRGLDSQGELSDSSGLKLIAADKSKGDDAMGKVRGLKAPGGDKGLLLLIVDEMPGLAPNLIHEAYTNLSTNPHFQMIGLGNPALKSDPFGKFSQPKAGWKSVLHKPDEWITERGKLIRFDAERSPLINETRDWTPEDWKTKTPKCHWMPDQEAINFAKAYYGPDSPRFCEQYSAIWATSKSKFGIYSETELMDAAEHGEPKWDNINQLTWFSGLDPAWTKDGDRTVAIFGVVGRVKGRPHLHIMSCETLELDEGKEIGLTQQVIFQWKNLCRQYGVKPHNAGFDHSGGGIPFGHVVDAEFSPSVQKINFGGIPSGRKYSIGGDSVEEFANRVSELWVQPKKFFRSGQISGLTPTLVKELVEREYAANLKDQKKIRVESKQEMKKRIQKSPDEADSFVILVEVAILSGLLESQEEKAIIGRGMSAFRNLKQKIRHKGRSTPKLQF